MGALVIIFFLDEKIRLNLQDFAAVVIINLGVSLMICPFPGSGFDRQNGVGMEKEGETENGQSRNTKQADGLDQKKGQPFPQTLSGLL